ncbi:hypothetical protein GIB67_014805 [Kingdonia uniflora]|uniref:Uncharacterized protein n=1 Tax=Kingdonia uniflora TaxID=39325 RepID=A0A7J7NVQ4_9MAGN|nr:hypothetical protein GIB67_014805 [Kingdonia uniflora]
MLASSAYLALPSSREVPTSEKLNLFIRKLNMCCVVFNFSDPSKNLKEKDTKRHTLLELVDYITMVTSKFNEIVVQEIMKMVSVNLFYTFPSGNFGSKILENYDPEEEKPRMEPSWPHSQIVYEFLLRMLPPSRSMPSSLNPIEQLPIPSPIHVGGSHEHFNTLGGGSSITFYYLFKATLREKGRNMYFLQKQKRKLMKSTNTMWRNGKKTLRKKYDKCDTDDERKKNCPKKTKPEDWVRFVDLTSTEEVKASLERNKINRSKMLTPHTTGRKELFRVVDEMMEVDPTITRSDSFLVGHTRSDGTFPTAFVEEKVV